MRDQIDTERKTQRGSDAPSGAPFNGRWLRSLPVLLGASVIIILLALIATMRLQDRAVSPYQLEMAVLAVDQQMTHLRGKLLLSQATQSLTAAAGVAIDNDAADLRVARLWLANQAAIDPANGWATRGGEALDAFLTDAASQLQAIRAGDFVAAATIDRDRLLPSFNGANEALHQATVDLAAKAAAQQRQEKLGSTLVLVVTALAIGGLFWRFARWRIGLAASVRTTEARLRTVVNHLPVILFAVDVHGVLTVSEGKTLALLGREPGGDVGASVFDTFGHLPEVVFNVREALAGKTVVATLRLRGVEFEATYLPITDPGGKITGVIGIATDVTEQQRAAQALSAERAFNLSVIESSLDGIVAFDRECRYTVWNSSMEQSTGLRRDQVIGRWAFDLFPFLQERGEEEFFVAALRGESRTSLPQPNGMPISGREGWYEAHYGPLRNVSGEVIGGLCVVRDVSERQAAEHDRSRLAALVESSRDAIIGASLDGVITDWNDGAERLYGFTSAEAIGRPLEALQRSLSKADGTSLFALVQGGEAIIARETTLRAKDGHDFDVSLTISPIRDGQGTVIGASMIARDMSERNRANAALRESDERFRGAFNSASIGMALVALDGRFLQVNSALAAIVGYSEEQLLTRTFQEITHPDDLGADLDLVERLRAGELRSFQLEKRYFHAEGHEVWVLMDVSVVRDLAAVPLYFVSQIQDITHRRESEMLLREAKEEAEHANQLKSEFVATVSHEFRTPLTSIKGYVELIRDGEAGAISDEQQGFLEIVHRNVGRLVILIRDLLDLAKMEAGHLEHRPQTVMIGEAVAQVQEECAVEAGEKGLTLTLHLAPDLSLAIADPAHLRQILANLIGNAVKFTDTGGVTVSAWNKAHEVAISVADKGIGIPEEAFAYIFEEFRQVDASITRRFGGTGLGLAIAQQLARSQGGTIEVSSRVGAGSVFTMRLPKHQALPPTADSPPDTTSAPPPPVMRS